MHMLASRCAAPPDDTSKIYRVVGRRPRCSIFLTSPCTRGHRLDLMQSRDRCAQIGKRAVAAPRHCVECVHILFLITRHKNCQEDAFSVNCSPTRLLAPARPIRSSNSAPDENPNLRQPNRNPLVTSAHDLGNFSLLLTRKLLKCRYLRGGRTPDV